MKSEDETSAWGADSADWVDSTGTIHPGDAAEPPIPAAAGLELGEVIGEGGMGVVRVARQAALRRDVAVKVARSPARQAELLVEAVVTGGLEHPNVVPIYALERGPDGVRLVMKRIAGTPWATLLRAPEEAARLARGRDLLAFHLGIFTSICDAVSAAHARGVVHRDLKPDNVMVGAFGEVYLLDWGLAVTTRSDDDRGLPPAHGVRRVAGTPAYLAPEQADPRRAPIGEHTDVYLLGAVLYEVVAGRSIHPGDTVAERIAHAAAGAVADWDGVDAAAELVRIVARATRSNPDGRYPSATALRDDVVRWLETRGADRLADEATRSLAALEALVARAEAGEDVDPIEANALLTQARFGFRQALLVRPGHPIASTALPRALQAGARFELLRGDPTAARALLRDLPRPPDELLAHADRLDAQARREAEEVADLRARTADLEIRRGAVARTVPGLVLGLFVAALCVGLGLYDRLVEPVGYGPMLAGVLLFDLGLLVGSATGALAGGFPTRLARVIPQAMVALAALVTLQWAGWAWMGLPVAAAIAGNSLISGTALTLLGIAVDRPSLWGGIVYVATFVAAVAAPRWALFTFGLGNLLAFGGYAALVVALDLYESRRR